MSILSCPRAFLWGSIVIPFSVFVSSNGYAQYYQNLTIGNPKALALGNAVTADPPGVDSIHFNPAGLYLATEAKNRNITEVNFIHLPKKELKYSANFTGELPENFNGFLGCDAECLLANDGSDSRSYTVDEYYSWVPWGGKTDPSEIAPRGGAAFIADDANIAFGTATYFLFQSGADLDTNAPGSYPRKELTGGDAVLLSPSVSIKFNDNLYFGLSIPIHYGGMELTSSFRLPNQYVSILNEIINETCDTDEPSEYCSDGGNQVDIYKEVFEANVRVEDTFTPSLNLGVLWRPYSWLTFGAVYQSEVDHEMEGTYRLRYAEGIGRLINTGLVDLIPNTPSGGVDPETFKEKGDVAIKQVLPAHYAFGVSVLIFPDLKLNIDYKKTLFSEWDELFFEFDGPTYVTGIVGLLTDDPPNTFGSPRGFVDGDNFAYGLEYLWNDRLALRVGYEMRESVIPKNMRSPAFSIGGDLTIRSFGFSYQYSRILTIDMAYAQIRSEQNISAGSSYSTTWDPLELYAQYPGYDISNELSLDMLLFGFQYYWN